MAVKAAGRVSERKQRSVFSRLGGAGTVNKVCTFWIAGRCNRNPCRFLHPEPPSQPLELSQKSHSKSWHRHPKVSIKKPSTPPSGGSVSEGKTAKQNQGGSGPDDKIAKQTPKKVCQYWLSGDCVCGEKCEYLHSWFSGDGFSMLAKLEGHSKAVKGIALPSGSNKLYTGCEDKTVRVWDCITGQCVDVVNLSGEVGSLISEGPWVLVGLPNAIKGWNSQTKDELALTEPVGQVYAMETSNNTLFAGTQDGTLLAWKSNSQTSGLELVASMKGHSGAVVSLVFRENRVYSGSLDHTIRVWDANTFECIHTLKGHTDVVMSVLCWENFLLSCSLDGTIKVWAATGEGNIQVIYTHKDEHGFLALCGIHDAEAKPILLCSLIDNTVRLYDLPSFSERGRLFAKTEVRAIQIGPDGLFFTGDATGLLGVWKLAGEPSAGT